MHASRKERRLYRGPGTTFDDSPEIALSIVQVCAVLASLASYESIRPDRNIAHIPDNLPPDQDVMNELSDKSGNRVLDDVGLGQKWSDEWS